MINERIIAEKFSVIWKQNFPILTANFIRVFNEAQISKINTEEVEVNENIRYDLVSESAFNLSESAIENEVSVTDLLSNKTSFDQLIGRTAKSIWKIEQSFAPKIELTPSELQNVLKLSDNIVEFINKTKKRTVKFRPKLKGYGIIPDLEADISIDDTLYEIKTVTRRFKSSDLKQLFIYLALRQVSERRTWKYAGLYNPRKGTYCKFDVNSFVYNLSGGNTPNEAFENLLNGLVRDIEIDSKF